MSYWISDLCINCGGCADDCPAGAIYPTPVQYQVDPEKCVDCGVCHDRCPFHYAQPDGELTFPPVVRARAARIVADKCIGCSLCARACPVHAISGEVRKPFTVDESAYIGCGLCFTKCRKDALAWVETGKPETVPQGAKADIDGAICIGCGLCKRTCPVDAISGEPKEAHTVDQDKCIACGLCVSRCKSGAVAWK